jgi:hypothetical protein
MIGDFTMKIQARQVTKLMKTLDVSPETFAQLLGAEGFSTSGTQIRRGLSAKHFAFSQFSTINFSRLVSASRKLAQREKVTF